MARYRSISAARVVPRAESDLAVDERADVRGVGEHEGGQGLDPPASRGVGDIGRPVIGRTGGRGHGHLGPGRGRDLPGRLDLPGQHPVQPGQMGTHSGEAIGRPIAPRPVDSGLSGRAHAGSGGTVREDEHRRATAVAGARDPFEIGPAGRRVEPEDQVAGGGGLDPVGGTPLPVVVAALPAVPDPGPPVSHEDRFATGLVRAGL